jgi:hypothetical protein
MMPKFSPRVLTVATIIAAALVGWMLLTLRQWLLSGGILSPIGIGMILGLNVLTALFYVNVAETEHQKSIAKLYLATSMTFLLLAALGMLYAAL